jgi:5-formyltetrahydrofolate cyclo-ligase
MKETLKRLSVEEKERQSSLVTRHLLNTNERFKNATHIALYLAMRHEEIDTIPLIETLLRNKDVWRKRVYVPHVPMSSKAAEATSPSDMVFYELKSIEQYKNEMSDDNKFKLRQFTSVDRLSPADPSTFELIIVPGLAFDTASPTVGGDGDNVGKRSERRVSRLGRGKGYYDRFLAKIPGCFTIGVGFTEQFLPLNNRISFKLPYDESRDVNLKEFVCDKLVSS